MSKYQLKCSCINCHTVTTTQSLTAHLRKCVSVPKNECKCCGKQTNNEHYCTRSCRAIMTNAARKKKIKISPPTSTERTMVRFLAGEISERPTIRKMLAIINGYKCSCCGLSTWQGTSITLIVDHVDGNAGDNRPENLRLICPNCNSQTDTFGGRNKGNGRKARGINLH